MKAIVVHEYGGPEVLRYEEFADPVIGEGQILVKLVATSVNPIDYKQRSGAAKGRFPIDFPGLIGRDVAGTVVKLGPGVTGFSEGDSVLAMSTPSYAQLAAVNAAEAIKLPDGMDLAEAAVIPLVTTTGHELISDAANVQSGQSVVITGALGMVGRSAVLTALRRGAYVIAAVRSSETAEASKLGAKQVIATDDGPALEALSGLDVVADTVGGELAEKLIGKIKSGGTYASVVGPPANAADYPEVKVATMTAHPSASILLEMAMAVRDGLLELPIGLRLPLSEAAKAHRDVEEHKVKGKVLLMV